MACLINIFTYLGKDRIAFHKHNEQKDHCQQDNYKELINLLFKYDNTLNNHLEKSKDIKNSIFSLQYCFLKNKI